MTKSIGKHDARAVRFWLEAGMNPNAVDGDGNTALGLALHIGNRDILHILLRHGADPNMSVHQKRFIHPLEKAISIDRLDLIEELIKFGSNPYEQNMQGESPMDSARKNSLFDIVEILEKYDERP